MAAAALIAAVAALVPTPLPQQAEAIPPFPIQDLGQGPSGQTNPNWASRLSGVSNTGNTYTSDGWLRLTNNRNGQATNILNNVAFPSTTGFEVTFDYRQSGGMEYTGTNAKYRTGDGIAMYLVDGTNSISVGADGNGLGYANGGDGGCQTPGVKGGYLGLGLDVYGNFASPDKGNYEGTHGDLPTAITLRGSGPGSCNSGPATAQYPYINGVTADLWTGSASNTNDPATYNSDYRRVTIKVEPKSSNVQVSVYMSAKVSKDKQPGAMPQLFTSDLSGVPGQVALPSTLKLGFSASTGAATDYHDIRAIRVAPLTDVAVTKSLSSTTPGLAGQPGSFALGDPISFTVKATNNGPTVIGNPPDGVARVYDDLSQLPISNVTWTCAGAGGGTCVTPSGSGSVVSADWYGPLGASVTLTVNGTVAGKPGSYTNTAVVPTNFTTNTVDPNSTTIQKDGSLSDTNLANNTASASFKVVAPHFTQTKTADQMSYAVGQAIVYTVTVSNDGPAPGTADLTDPVPSGVSVTDATCQGAGSATCTVSHSGNNVSGTITAPPAGSATYTITGTVVAGPTLTNTATVAPTSPGCDVTDCGGGPATVTRPVLAPALTLTKDAVSAAGDVVTTLTAGQPVTYRLTVTNAGETAVDGLTISEDSFTGSGALGQASCPETSLATGASTICTAAYTVTQADVDAGTVVNTATAHGTASPGNAPVSSNQAAYTLTAGPAPAVTLVKSGALATGAAGKAGDLVNYTFTATNSGNVTLTDVVITDPLPGLSALTYAWPGPAGVLAPGQKVTATASHPLTQADVDAGSVSNTATVTGKDPKGTTVQAQASAKVTLPPAPQLALVKSVSFHGGPAVGLAVGSVVDYAFDVTNTGNVSLSAVGVDETAFTGSGTMSAIACPATTLAPGAAVTCTATYELTQADINRGSVDNTAVAHGTPPGSTTPVPSNPSSVHLPIDQGPKLGLTKTGALAPGAPGQAGDTVTYSFTATNEGNVTLTDVVIADPLPGLSALTYAWPGDAGVLTPGQPVTATATYQLKQADVDAGQVDNTATATGKDPHGDPVSAQATFHLPIPPRPSLGLTKAASPHDAAAPLAVGAPIDYTFAVTNTGNVTLTAVGVEETAFSGTGQLSAIDCPAGPLAPGASLTCRATYGLTQADVDAGTVTNTAVAHGTPPRAAEPISSNPASAEIPIPQTPSITLVKSGALAPGSTGRAGDTVQYSFTATNNGNVTLTHVAITDPLPGLSALTYAWPGAGGRLAPGDRVTATATYALTQADVDAGVVNNTATVKGDDPKGNRVQAQATATVPVPQAPAIHLVKTGALAPDAQGVAGDQIAYTFEATNTGNVTLSQSTITDPLPGLSEIVCQWPGAVGVLAPGQTVTAMATHALTQADVDAGVVDNTATAAGTSPKGVRVEDPSSVEVPLPARPLIHLVKTAALADGAQGVVGDLIDYTYVSTNTGNVTLTGVTITDPLPNISEIVYDSWPGEPGVLAPGQEVHATATYQLTQADIDAGHVGSPGLTQGTDPRGTVVEDTCPTDTPVVPTPSVSVVKTGKFQPGAYWVAGSRVDYTFTATNTGNVTLANVTIVDPRPGLTPLVYGPWPGEREGTLKPGESVSASAHYLLTAADAAKDSITNQAHVIGDNPDGSKTEADSNIVVVTGPLPVTGAAVGLGAIELAVMLLGAGGLLVAAGWRRRVTR